MFKSIQESKGSRHKKPCVSYWPHEAAPAVGHMETKAWELCAGLTPCKIEKHPKQRLSSSLESLFSSRTWVTALDVVMLVWFLAAGGRGSRPNSGLCSARRGAVKQQVSRCENTTRLICDVWFSRSLPDKSAERIWTKNKKNSPSATKKLSVFDI